MLRPKRLVSILFILIASCSDGEADRPRQEEPKAEGPAPAAIPSRDAPVRPQASASESGSALQAIQAYYGAIAAGDYEAALAYRDTGGGRVTAAALAQNFERYLEHHARPGTPSEPVEAGDWLYVEVPVHLYGRLRDGRPYNIAGTVTLRRRKSGGGWLIYTG